MSRRIEIELTSARPDGTWTWRAAGAREPKGVLEGSLLPEGAKNGDVLRAEADFAIDGINILEVLPPKGKRSEPELLEMLGSGRSDGPGVTTQLVGRRGRGPGSDDRPRRRPDGPRGEGDRRDGPRRPRREGGEAGGGTGGPSGGGRRREGEGRPREQGPRRPAAEGRPGGAGGEGAERRRSGADRSQAGRPTAPAAKARAKRLTPSSAHRTAVLESLTPEERAVAEQVLRGGVPAVRTALHLEREKAQSEGRPAPDSDALLTLAERLLPRLRSAEWRDRAEAASKSLDDIGLRDLRAVVTGADLARDDESRELASTLRDALEAKLTAMRDGWFEEIRGHLAAGRTIRAVRLSGRPPEPSSRLPAELLEELTTHAGRTLAPTTSPDAWGAMVEAVAQSPVRRGVKPEGLPANATPELLRAAQQQAGRIPSLASLLGMAIPPPPGPRRRLAEGARPPRPGAPIPPAPQAHADPAPEAGPEAVAPEPETVASEPTDLPEVVTPEDVTPEAAPEAVTAEPVVEPALEDVVTEPTPEPPAPEPAAAEVVEPTATEATATEPSAPEPAPAEEADGSVPTYGS